MRYPESDIDSSEVATLSTRLKICKKSLQIFLYEPVYLRDISSTLIHYLLLGLKKINAGSRE